MRIARILLILLPVCFVSSVWADVVEVRRAANVYAKASRHSKVLKHIDPTKSAGPYVMTLAQSKRQNGYYRVKLQGRNKKGWIYKSLVRRYQDRHPDAVSYKRSLYRHWVDDDGDCQNTRAESLIRDDDDQQVRFKTARGCVVKRGTWTDPYTGSTFRDAGKLDVDHVVPLKNAHESGAWAWSKAKRRQYANYLEDRNHLLSVSASENRKKGAKGPDKYMPPNQSYHCEYIQIWVKIKRDWELEMTESEGAVVQRVLDSCRH